MICVCTARASVRVDPPLGAGSWPTSSCGSGRCTATPSSSTWSGAAAARLLLWRMRGPQRMRARAQPHDTSGPRGLTAAVRLQDVRL